jgi:hypothetical protein
MDPFNPSISPLLIGWRQTQYHIGSHPSGISELVIGSLRYDCMLKPAYQKPEGIIILPDLDKYDFSYCWNC